MDQFQVKTDSLIAAGFNQEGKTGFQDTLEIINNVQPGPLKCQKL